MSRVVAPPVAAPPAALANGPVQVSVATGAAGFLTVGALWLAARYGPRQGALLLVGAPLGLTLHHAVFGFTAAYRALVTVGDGRGVRAQLLMLAVATVLFAPVLAAGEIFGASVAGAVAPAGVSVLVGAFVFGVGMQIAGGCCSTTPARASRRCWPRSSGLSRAPGSRPSPCRSCGRRRRRGTASSP